MEVNGKRFQLNLEFYTGCVRHFHDGHYVHEYKIKIDTAKQIFKTEIKHKKSTNFYNFLIDLNRVKAVQRRKDDIIEFNHAVYDAITSDPTYVIPRRQSKKIVSQTFAFKDPSKPKPTVQNNTNSKVYGLSVGVLTGHGNVKEHVNCFNRTNLPVQFENTTLTSIQLIDISLAEPSDVVVVPPLLQPVELLPNEKYVLNIALSITEIGTIPIILYTKFMKGAVNLLCIKTLFLNNLPEEYNELLNIIPYKRTAPIIKEYNFVVVDGEKPPAVASFKPMIPLNSYSLKNNFIEVINAGLKPNDVNDECKKLCKSIIDTLNVPTLNNPLTPENYCKLLDLLLDLEEHQMQIDIRSYDMNDAKLVKEKGNKLFKLNVPGLSENRPSLIVGDYVDINDEATKTKYRGYVHFKGMDYVHISMSRSFAEKVYIPNKGFDVSFGYNRTTIKLEHRAVSYIKQSMVQMLFFPTTIPDNKFTNLSLKWERNVFELNAQQKNAVMHILNKTAYPAPYIIFGPPGTGKTVTVVEAIKQIYNTMPEKKILVCTPSNFAANVINVRLSTLPQRHLLRYISYSFPYKEINEEILKYCNYQEGEYYHPHIDAILDYRIVITTLTNAGRLLSLGVPVKHFDYVFIDESGHATETETLIPLAGLFCDKTCLGQLTGQIVMAGDPEQLGPIIHSSIAAKYGFGTSMLERLMKTLDIYKKNEGGDYDSDIITKLLENYRSHKVILSIPNQKFYDNELIAKAGPMSQVAIGSDILKNREFPMIFHSVEGQDMREGSSPSFFNLLECNEVMDILKQLIGSKMSGMKIETKHIGIITPYRKQVKKIKELCKIKKYDNLTVGSVEQFQGQERLIIIISTVRSSVEHIEHDQKFHLGFLKNRKRFNVAITRAKALVIVVGNPNLLQYDEYWRAYIQLCVENNSVTGKKFKLKTEEELSLDESFQLISSMKTLQINDEKTFKRGDI